jgi:hypothetical protein
LKTSELFGVSRRFHPEFFGVSQIFYPEFFGFFEDFTGILRGLSKIPVEESGILQGFNIFRQEFFRGFIKI